MATPVKPWERSVLNQRPPSFRHEQIEQIASVHPYMSDGGGGGSRPPVNRPPLPPRPNTINRTTSNQYSPLSSYGGGYSSSYGGGYGTMQSPFGGYGGYGYGMNRFGMMGSGALPGSNLPDEGFIQAAEESSRQAFQSIESIVHAFGSISMMLESTYTAVYSSFRAVLGVAEHFSRMKSHFAQIFSALAVIRTLKWVYRKLQYIIGFRSDDPSLEAMWRAASTVTTAELSEADLKTSRSSWPILMFLGVVCGGPYLIWRLLSSIAPTVKEAKSSFWIKGLGEHYAAVAQYDFQAGLKSELSFQAGQSMILAPKDQQPNVRGWLLASDGKMKGLVPANYLKILGLRKGPPASGSAISSQKQKNAEGISENIDHMKSKISTNMQLNSSEMKPETYGQSSNMYERQADLECQAVEAENNDVFSMAVINSTLPSAIPFSSDSNQDESCIEFENSTEMCPGNVPDDMGKDSH